MADETRVAKRYVGALFAVADKDGQASKVADDLDIVMSAMKDAPDLKEVLTAPVISVEHKVSVLEKVFSKYVTPLTLRFLSLLARKRRLVILDSVSEQYLIRLDEKLGKVKADVFSAAPLTTEQADDIAKALAVRTGKTVQVNASVDAELIGGILVRIGDTVLDGSVRGRMERLRQQLLAAR